MSCKDTSGNIVELVKKTDKVADPTKVKQDILDAEQSISNRLTEIQSKKATLVPQLDAVIVGVITPEPKVEDAKEIDAKLNKIPTQKAKQKRILRSKRRVVI